MERIRACEASVAGHLCNRKSVAQRGVMLAGMLLALLFAPAGASAQTAPTTPIAPTLPTASTPPTNPAPGSAQSGLTIELNKLEPLDKSCRAYFVVDNPGDKAYQALKLDIAIFLPSGVIDRRARIDLAPLKAAKRSVRQFDFEALACDKVGIVLADDAVECKTDAGPVADCFSGMVLKSLVGGVTLGK